MSLRVVSLSIFFLAVMLVAVSYVSVALAEEIYDPGEPVQQPIHDPAGSVLVPEDIYDPGNNVLSPQNTSKSNPGNNISKSNPGDGPAGLKNPLKFNSIPEFLLAIIDIILIFAVPIIVLFIMYAGFLYVTARGDTGQISTAHSALTWAVVGGVIVLGAKILLTVVQGTVKGF